MAQSTQDKSHVSPWTNTVLKGRQKKTAVIVRSQQ